MLVHFGQIYIQAGASFPFSHQFQRRISYEVTALAAPSALFIKKYGADFELMFRISAKRNIEDNEIRGPSVFRKSKDIEYTIFLPYDVIKRHADVPRQALNYLLKGVCEVFDWLEIDKAGVIARQSDIIEKICRDPKMTGLPSWDEM